MQHAVRRPDPANVGGAGGAWPPNGTRAPVAAQDKDSHESNGNRRASLELDKKAGKAKDLSHVPCKFHKQGSCQAGKSCPFSHDLTVPGTTKPICQWYAKGNCKFGHKCALAHILPGQPMSFDRKNKRAAQAALREAQNAGHATAVPVAAAPQEGGGGGGAPPTSPPKGIISEPSPPSHGSGIARSLKNSLDMGRPAPMTAPPVRNAWTAGGPPINGTNGVTPSGEPVAPFSAAPPPLATTSTLNPTATFIPAPSGLTQGRLSQQLGNSANGGRSSVAAQLMLSQQSRRMSNNSNSASLSPTRLPPSQQQQNFGSSPPLAVPLPSTNGTGGGGAGGSTSIFGTSPFSGGSNALFMPSSYDSSDDAFPRSPPNRTIGVAEAMQRTGSSGWDNQHANFFGSSTSDDAVDDEDEEYEEGFLPSSLNELLTPEEQRRRASRMTSLFDPFQNSRSVPAELTLSRGRPTAPVNSNWGESSTMTIKASSSRSPHISPPPPSSRSYLAVGSPPRPHDNNSLHAQLHHYSASFDPSTGFGAGYQQQLGSLGQILPAPGSLPGGLAAGLSQLHLIPADHTGDTPPIGSPFGGTTAPPSTASLSPPGAKSVWNGAPLSWSSSNSDHHPPSPQGFTLGQGTNGHVPSNLKLPMPSAVPRRLSGNGGVGYGAGQGSSPLHQAVGPGQYEDDIQFDMD